MTTAIVVLGSPNDAQGRLSTIAVERCQQAPRHGRAAERERSEQREQMPSLHAQVSLIRAHTNARAFTRDSRGNRSREGELLEVIK